MGSWALQIYLKPLKYCCYLVSKLRLTYFLFGSRHLEFSTLLVRSHIIAIRPVWLLDLENIGLAVQIALIPCVQADINIFSVLIRPTLRVVNFRLGLTVVVFRWITGPRKHT